MQEIRRCLKPGGYIELKELDFVIFDPGPITAKFTAAGKKKKKDLASPHYFYQIH